MKWAIAFGLAALIGAGLSNPATASASGYCPDEPGKVAGWTPPVRTSTTRPRYPGGAQLQWSEGWVHLLLSIKADGSVSEVVALDGVGNESFRKAAIKAVSQWKYEPAKLNGQPVDAYGIGLEIHYDVQGSVQMAWHEDVVKKYNKALGLVQQQKANEAIEILKRAFDRPATHFEQAMVSALLARAYLQINDRAKARESVAHALFDDGKSLDPKVVPFAFAMRILLETENGNLNGALCGYKKLQKFDPNWRKGEDAAKYAGLVDQTIARLEKALSQPDPISVAGRIEVDFEDEEVWVHPVLRRKFAFESITGKADRFRLFCTGVRMEAVIDPTLEWSIPDEAGRCTIVVSGSRGSTFNFIEMK